MSGWLRICTAALLCSVAGGGLAQQSERASSATLRSWGDDQMAPVMRAWETEFQRRHPDVRSANSLLGSASGMAGIITGISQLAVMGRQATANEVMGFEWVFRYKPRGFEVLTGSLATAGQSPALAVLVHRSNPVTQLTLDQLRRMLACCEAGEKISHWGQLGAAGAWQGREIHAYLYDNETGTGAFFERAVLGTGDKWDWERVREFRDVRRQGHVVRTAEEQIMAAFARDPDGIAVCTMACVKEDAKAVALARQDGGPYYLPAETTVASRDYPLSRAVYLYVNAQPGKPFNALVSEFLAFVLSSEGQEIAVRAAHYLPLPEQIAVRERQEVSQ